MTSSATLPESLPVPRTTELPLLTGSYANPITIGIVITAVLAVGVCVPPQPLRLRLPPARGRPQSGRRRARRHPSTDASSSRRLPSPAPSAALAGAMMLHGEQHVLKAGFSSGYGFDGLVVGLLARGSVVGVLAGALLFGFMRSAGITMEMLGRHSLGAGRCRAGPHRRCDRRRRILADARGGRRDDLGTASPSSSARRSAWRSRCSSPRPANWSANAAACSI